MKFKNLFHEKGQKVPGEDPEYKVEQITQDQTADMDSGEENKHPPHSSLRKMHICAFAATVILILLAAVKGLPEKHKTTVSKKTEPVEEFVSVTEAEKESGEDPESGKAEETETLQKRIEEQIEAAVKENSSDQNGAAFGEDTSWQETIFGNPGREVMTSQITISGLTENEKNLTGFRESDFIRSLSAFLVVNNTRTSGVTFTGSIACSAGEAAAYTADLKGIKDRKLIVLFFPRYPGKYLFVLETVKEKQAQETEKTKNVVQTQPADPIQTAPVQSIAQTASAVNNSQTEPAYDAMRLNVKKMPDELSNYLANSYELQYSLYDYLYNRGIRNAENASVTDYYIDSDERTAAIQIAIDGVGSVTAIYDRDGNSYDFQ